MSENRRRNKTLTIRVTEDELAEIIQQTMKARLNLTEFILASTRRTEIILPPDTTPLLKELKRIGGNINQIAARVNSGAAYAPGLKEAAKALLDALLPLVAEAGLDLAVQGCEHINRSLCCSRATMKKYGLQQVWVKPWLHAGGACVTGAYERIPDAVMVESLNGQATLGIDVGDTLIGMHLHCVAVPVHSPLRHIGEANLVMAFSRPKYVGGPRAQYDNAVVDHKHAQQ